MTAVLPEVQRLGAGFAHMTRRDVGVRQTRGMQAAAILVLSFGVGAIPFSYVAGRRARGVDLRRVGTGTVSGSSLYRVAGFWPMAAAGVLDVAKGAAGPGLAMAAGHPALAAVAGGVAVAGHNWSPFLRGAGGRGISPALGALLVVAWPGTVLLLVGMIVGKAFGETAVGALGAELALTPVLAVTHGAVGALAGIAITIPMVVKRVVGNGPAQPPRGRTYRNRILYDRDQRVVSQAP
jgi:acyl phosphate:glycerol-3-phosphate acyltransferase